MLWKRSQADATGPDAAATITATESEATSPAAPRDTSHEDAAIDTVVAILRALGRSPFGVGDANPAELSRLYERWATHLAIGGPHPDGRPVLSNERDWVGARRFVQLRREQECDKVAMTVAHSHELIWEMTDHLAEALLDTRERDREVVEELVRLREAISSGSLQTVEQAVNRTATVLTGAIKQREERLQTRLEELGSRVAELTEQLQEVKVESRLDGLTRVPNRADFDKAIQRWHHVGSAFARPTCLILIDLDNLKQINDQYGHRGGDAALRVFANALVECFPRRSDFVGRFGGDEFVVLLAETPARPGLRLAERFRQHLHMAQAEHDGQTIRLTASLGLAQLEPGESIESWLERADQALYEAKAAGRDRVAFARPADLPPTVAPAPPSEGGGREAAG